MGQSMYNNGECEIGLGKIDTRRKMIHYLFNDTVYNCSAYKYALEGFVPHTIRIILNEEDFENARPVQSNLNEI